MARSVTATQKYKEMWKNKTDLFFLINQPIFHISYLFISFFAYLLRRDDMVYKDLTGTQVCEVDLHFTFWPKEGSIAWFVAVGPSVVLQEKEKHHDLWMKQTDTTCI